MSENFLEVYRALRESPNRYMYFLLAASGAGIGLAVSQTQNARHIRSGGLVLGAELFLKRNLPGTNRRLRRQGTVTNSLRNERADAVSMRYVLSVARQNRSPVTVTETIVVVSLGPAPRKCGPPESP